MQQRKILITGMTCESCEQTVKKTLQNLKGIKAVSASYLKGEAYLKGDQIPSDRQLHQALQKQGYGLGKAKFPWLYVGGLLGLGLAFVLIQRLYGSFIFDPSQTQLSAGLIVLYALVSSLHCMSMCGGLSLGITLHQAKPKQRAISYHLGRILSYTLSGFILGLVGQQFTLNPVVTNLLYLISGGWMLILSLKMANILKFEFPKLFTKTSNTKGPFIIGLLNALMPCGSLQTVQVMALSSTSPWLGAMIMLTFAVITAPSLALMQWVGHTWLGRKRQFIQVLAALLVALFGLQMMLRSDWISSPISQLTQSLSPVTEFAPLEQGIQKLQLRIEEGHYTLDYNQIKAGVPVQISFSATQFLGCANPIQFDFLTPMVEIDVLKNPEPITFTLDQTGVYVIHCWMNMEKISLYVEK